MKFDYSASAATAIRLLEKFGVEVSLFKVPEQQSNPNMPWSPPSDLDLERNAVKTNAVFVDPVSGRKLGLSFMDSDGVRSASRYAIFDASKPVEDFHQVNDGVRTFKIIEVEQLKPAGVTLLYFAALE